MSVPKTLHQCHCSHNLATVAASAEEVKNL